MLTTPFTLWLALEAYTGESASPLPAAGAFETRRLLTDFVRRRLLAVPAEQGHMARNVLPWLQNLALCGSSGRQTRFALQDMRETWFASRWPRWISRIVLVLVSFLVCAAVELAVWFPYRLWTLDCDGGRCGGVPFSGYSAPLRGAVLRYVAQDSAMQAILGGCVVGIPAAVAGLFLILRPAQLIPRDSVSYRVRESLKKGLAGWLSGSIFVASVGFGFRCIFNANVVAHYATRNSVVKTSRGGVYYVYDYLYYFTLFLSNDGKLFTPQLSIVLGACVGFLFLLSSFLASEAGPQEGDFARSIRKSVWTPLLLGGVFGVLSSLIPISRFLRIPYLEAPDIPVGGALLIMLTTGGLYLFRHCIMRVMMVVSGRGPWRYGRFLDKATEYYFLRRVGGTEHMFPHPLLLDYFASLREPFNI